MECEIIVRTNANQRTHRISLLNFLIVILLIVLGTELGAPKLFDPRAKPFVATDTDGRPVSFPRDYQGKIVLIDFWATWCEACMIEMPNTVRAYRRYHRKGLEVLGVSLDNEGSAKQLPNLVKNSGMNWRTICDHQGWRGKIAKLYGIRSIPYELVVDGSTGKILAQGEKLRGEGLSKILAASLARH